MEIIYRILEPKDSSDYRRIRLKSLKEHPDIFTAKYEEQVRLEKLFFEKQIEMNSKEAFVNTRGDCEDHALALTDWLIEMNVDARVVLGSYKNEGHAWVVVFLDNSVFLLESTSKLKSRSWRHYPLAKFETDYHPKYMFNRDYFWLNTGSIYTTRYDGNNWVKRSRFFRNEG